MYASKRVCYSNIQSNRATSPQCTNAVIYYLRCENNLGTFKKIHFCRHNISVSNM